MFGLFISWNKNEYSCFPLLYNQIDMEFVAVAGFMLNKNEVNERMALANNLLKRSILPEKLDNKSGLMKQLCQLSRVVCRNRSVLSEEQGVNCTGKKWQCLFFCDTYDKANISFEVIDGKKNFSPEKRKLNCICHFGNVKGSTLC